MNASYRYTLSALAIAAAAVISASPALAADCTAPQGVAMTRACAKVAEGSNEFRRYVERTQGIYALSFQDYVDNLPADTKLADAQPAPAQQVALNQ